MTTVGPGPARVTARFERTDWVAALSIPGPEQDRALADLHGLLLRAARRQVQRMGHVTFDMAEELANQAAYEALITLLGKLHTFEGRSRFTTWAYKFAVLQAATAVRTLTWQDREIHLDGMDLVADGRPGPGQYAEAADLAVAVRAALDTELSPHQRRVVLALLVDEVPIDVLAERLGTNRNALYKALHDARKRLRTHLTATGFLDEHEDKAGRP